MAVPRRICVVTGSRADYGLLYWLMKEIAADLELRLQLVVTGMHLAPQYGLTCRQIEADGFTADATVPTLLDSDTPAAIARAMGAGIAGVAAALERLEPDLLVVLGDRYEILAAAQAALVARVPIAHIHGGEASEGAYDESIRHALTKMAQWHFVAAEPYRRRVIQMGEAPERVFNCGAPGLDHLARLTWLNRAELEESPGIPPGRPLFLVTYHPATLADEEPRAAMAGLVAALEEFPRAAVVFTYPNADTGGRALIECVDGFVARHAGSTRAYASLGQQRYLSLMRMADVIIGNSSSALTEAPALKIAAVNIGERQKGRLKATSVIDAPANGPAIARAIERALSEEFRAGLPETVSLYGGPGASLKIKTILKSVVPTTRKSFFDIGRE